MNIFQRMGITTIEEDSSMDINERESLEFANQFNYDQFGLITNPGKFERECKWLPYYYNMGLLGAQDDTLYEYFNEDTCIAYDIFNLNIDDWTLFLDLTDVRCIAIWEDSYGFVHCDIDPDLSLLED